MADKWVATPGYNSGEGTFKNWVDLADEAAAAVGVDPVILKATIEAEYSGENKFHSHLKKYDQAAVGYGGVLLYYWYKEVPRAADLMGIAIPDWARNINHKPKGTLAKELGQLMIENDRLSMATAALVVKHYWDKTNQNFREYTLEYVGPKTPEKDIERRHKIYQKWQNNPDASSIPNYTSKVSENDRDSSDPDAGALWEGGSTGRFYLNGGNYDGEVFEGITGILDKSTGVAPHYYEDDFTQLMHRYTQGDFYLRIGDSRFVVPPTQITVSEQSQTQRYHSIRQKQSMKTQTGNKMKTIELTLMFTDYNQINGFEMEGPAGDLYYMDGLRSLIAQMKTMPFLPVENEYLNGAHKIFAVAILSCNVSTVQGFPGMLQADLSLIEFDAETYLNKPTMFYDSHFMWPLFRWHYQRLLNARTKQYDIMAPYIGSDSIDFYYLNEEALQNKADEIKKKNAERLENGERAATWFDYNGDFVLGKDDKVSNSDLFEKHDIPQDFQIVNIMGSTGNTLTPLTPQLLGKPTFQYFGSQDTRFNLLIHTTKRETVESFNLLKDKVDGYAREYRDRFVSSHLKVENNFINMMGIESVLIESLTVSTVEGSPESFYIAISLVSYDETQYRDEKLGRLDTYDMRKGLAGNMEGGNLEHFDNYIINEVRAEQELDKLELYPDLDLPTYTEANEIIPIINAWRRERSLPALPLTELTGPSGGIYVDPDFYFSYPSIEDLLADYKESLNNPIVKELSANAKIFEEDEEAIEQFNNFDPKEFFGPKAIAQIERDEPDGIDQIKEAHEAFDFSDPSAVASRLDGYRLYVADPHQYVKRFWIQGWHPGNKDGYWESPVDDVDNTDENYRVLYYHKQSALATTKVLSDEGHFKGMVHDMYKYDKRGTMMRAFPTYCLVLIDEGMYINVRKLWDNYYTYHSVSEINVHMDRKNPMHTAYIKLSNIYGALNNQDKFGRKLTDIGLGNIWDSIQDSFVTNVEERELLERRLVYNSIELLAGARLHIRMGYGSTASQLPPMFNGVIAEINTGEMVDIVAQSFGYEVTNQISVEPGEQNSPFEEGLEATELFRYYMTERNSNYTWRWRNSADPENYQSAYGIQHFGFLRVRDTQNFWDIFNGTFWDHEKEMSAEDYDIMKNIYSTAGYVKYGIDEKNLDGASESERRDAYLEQGDYPYVKKYKGASTDLSRYDIRSGLFGTLDEIKNWKDAQSLIKAMDDHNEEDRGVFLRALYTWAANNPSQGLEYFGSPSNHLLWSDSHFGANQEALEKLIEPLKDVDEGQYTEALDILSNIQKEWHSINTEVSKDQEDQEEAQDDGMLDADEKNVRMQLEGKSPWDVFRTLERVTPEYVVYPHVHQFHYTLFFGKPWWDVQCGYVLPPIKNRPDLYGQKISDYVELSKPFSQFHYYNAQSDILKNTIKAVGSNLMTAVTPIFEIGSGIGSDERTYEIIWADYYIRGSFQKMQTVDTTLVQNVPMVPDLLERGLTSITNWFGGSTKYQKHAVHFAQNAIAESFRDMYQGEILVLGDPTAKPYDLFYMDDLYSQMNGSAEMGKVTHMMSVDTGFVTSIKPDLAVVTNPDPDKYSREWPGNPELAAGNFFRLTHSIQYGALRAIQAYATYKVAQVVLRTMSPKVTSMVGITKATHARIVSNSYVKMLVQGNRIGRAASGATALTGRVIGGVGRGAGGLIQKTGIVNVIRTAKTAATGYRVAALAAIGLGGAAAAVPTAATFILSIGAWFGAKALIEATQNMFVQKYNNVIKIFPFFYKGVPYVAGINGHKSLIPGWQDSGSGQPMRIPYDHIKETNPMRASDVMNINSDAHNGGYNGIYHGGIMGGVQIPADTKFVGDIPASQWARKITSDEVAMKKPMFAAPISLYKDEIGSKFAAVSKMRVSRGFHPPSDPDHAGVDFIKGNPNGNNREILAFAKGTVMFSGGLYGNDKDKEGGKGYGNLILIRHEIPQTKGEVFVFYTLYAHLPANKIFAKQRATVGVGQLIGLMGNTGGSRGPHLHFEILVPKNQTKTNKFRDKFGRSHLNHVLADGPDKVNDPRANMIYKDPLAFMAGIIKANVNLFTYIENR